MYASNNQSETIELISINGYYLFIKQYVDNLNKEDKNCGYCVEIRSYMVCLDMILFKEYAEWARSILDKCCYVSGVGSSLFLG